ncbi:hypothetical protein FHU10_0475 [Serratia fonticola]|uniref:Uncharacterized protein n=1 Tax=Serratia fonticola TaxID=47917 RepID=A0A542BLL5_SERFO|nr:hypothetical protein FHU09_1975 [Serratia fonticola]TQI98530.1 hypothetical protein FHU11_4073 [Serratia fonticola]TVZ68058.1 hypothetical protein FHU10_0475 [Serratia fonticola]
MAALSFNYVESGRLVLLPGGLISYAMRIYVLNRMLRNIPDRFHVAAKRPECEPQTLTQLSDWVEHTQPIRCSLKDEGYSCLHLQDHQPPCKSNTAPKR